MNNKDRCLIDSIDSLLNAYVAQAISKAEFFAALEQSVADNRPSPEQAARDSFVCVATSEAYLMRAQMHLGSATRRLRGVLGS